MDKLANYGSDDDYEDSPRNRKADSAGYEATSKGRGEHPDADVNYDEVQMDMSEDTDSSSGSNRDRSAAPRRSGDRHAAPPRQASPRPRDRRRNDDPPRRYRSGRDDRHKDRHQRTEKHRRRSPSRDRERRSRSPARSRNDYHTKTSSSSSGHGRKYGAKANVVPERTVEVPKQELPAVPAERKPISESDKDRFFMPGITGRFRDQIERRKLLWQKKDEAKPAAPATSTSTKVWQTTTFAQDTDGKVASKFKRLMGIKDQSEQSKQVNDGLKRQEEMFSSMEQQYEVARTATHTMRGVGLGFGSYQR